MAYVDPTQNPDDQSPDPSQVDQALKGTAQAGAQPTDSSAPEASGGGGAGVVSGGGGSAPAPAAAKPSSSGSWTNLQSYLDANQDQGATVGNQIAGTINDQGSKAQNDISNLGANFNSAVKDNTVEQDPNAVSGAINAATTATANQGIGQDQVAAYQKQANASYRGPTDATNFNGYSQAQQDLNTAQTSSAQTQSEAGRDVLLNNQYKNASANGYSQGENNLDQMLLQNSSGGQAALQPLAKQWSGLNGALSNTVSAGNSAVANAEATDQATSAAAQGALSSASSNFQNQLNTGLADLQKTDTSSYHQILADLNNGTISADDYKALGIDPTQHIYTGNDATGNRTGVDLPSYLNQGTAPTLQTYANADQYAQAAALAQLAGQGSSSFLSPASAAQAGTAATTPAYTFANDQFKSANTAAQGEYNAATNDLISNVQQSLSEYPGEVQSATNIPQLISAMAKLRATYGDTSGYYDQQMNRINELQIRNGLPTYPAPWKSSLAVMK